MITVEDLRTKEPEDMAANLAYTVEALIGTARRALEADGQEATRDGHARITLELAEELAHLVVCTIERLEIETQRGIYGPKPEKAA